MSLLCLVVISVLFKESRFEITLRIVGLKMEQSLKQSLEPQSPDPEGIFTLLRAFTGANGDTAVT